MARPLLQVTIASIAVLTPVIGVAGESAKSSSFRAGAAKADITPQQGVSLNGTISKPGPVLGINDPLHARALVLSDGHTQIAIVTVDACMVGREVFDNAKAEIAKKTDLSADRMLMAATHTHRAGRLIHVSTGKLDDAYHKQVSRQIAEAVIQAHKNLAPAQIGYARFERPDLIACRRHLCEPGTVRANPFGETDERIKSVAGRGTVLEPAGPVDPEFSILSVQHADGSPLAILGNFSVHYCGGYRKGIVSADYFGHYAAALESKLASGGKHPPFVGIMSNGTSGNTGAIKRVTGRNYEPYEWLEEAGKMLAEQTMKALDDAEYQKDVSLEVATTELKLGVRKPSAERLAWARDLLENPEKETPHRWSRIYAGNALRLAEYPETVSMPLQAYRIGDIAITAMPCEVFAETGLAIKEKSPLERTFSMELANAYGGYLPPPKQHTLGGYETWPAQSSFLEVQAEAKIREGVLRLLEKVAKKED